MSEASIRNSMKGSFIDVADSPIERMLLTAIAAHIGALAIRSSDLHGASLIERVSPQHKVGRYRIDIAIFTPAAKIAIECDGHQFHEKTKEQARRDSQRGRALAADGWRLIRFTGSEIHRNPFVCAMEVMDTIRDLNLSSAA